MVVIGEFHKESIDGEVYLVYHNVEYPSPQTHNSNSSNKVFIDELPLQPLFLCPSLREFSMEEVTKDLKLFKCETPPLYDGRSGHHVLPLFWCNNKEADPDGECDYCELPKVSTCYYYCVECDERYHKECVEAPLEIHHPSHFKLSPHSKHSLQLFLSENEYCMCTYCGGFVEDMLYYCTHCDSYMHVFCAKVRIPFYVYKSYLHNHSITLFPRQASLTCNVCGLVNKDSLTYVCAECNFVAHQLCMGNPLTIRISRHDQHRISFVSSLPLEEHLCRICHKGIDCDYGAYVCNMCSDYVVHTNCALRGDIWDTTELEGAPNEEYENVEPFVRKDDGGILHFSHGHHLRLLVCEVYDEKKFCQACGLSIYEGNFYACSECNFILHEVCANAPCKKYIPVHAHKLNLQPVSKSNFCVCFLCSRVFNGFEYACPIIGCGVNGHQYKIDIRCAMVSEPFTYQGHPHPLYLSLGPREKAMCLICKSPYRSRVLNCIVSECDFIICFKCATLPYTVRYKHDKHYLTFRRGEEAIVDWCEICEGKLAIGGEEGFYKCDDCCTTLHINCLLGTDPYLVHGKDVTSGAVGEVHLRCNDSPSRKICNTCQKRCPYPLFLEGDEKYFCCRTCVRA